MPTATFDPCALMVCRFCESSAFTFRLLFKRTSGALVPMVRPRARRARRMAIRRQAGSRDHTSLVAYGLFRNDIRQRAFVAIHCNRVHGAKM